MEHILGFTLSHWMPPSVKCLRRITLAAAMVKEFESNTQNTNKKQLLASNYDLNMDPLLSSLMRRAMKYIPEIGVGMSILYLLE